MMDILGDKFKASLDVAQMRKDANRIAKTMGVSGPQADAFRHAYVSAKVKEKYGDTAAMSLGWVNEMRPNNDIADEDMDIVNNKEGRAIHDEVMNEVKNIEGYDQASDDEREQIKERVLRQKVFESTQNGRLITSSKNEGDKSGNQTRYNQQYNGTGDTDSPPSILDYFGSLASSISNDLQRQTQEDEGNQDWRNNWLTRLFGR